MDEPHDDSDDMDGMIPPNRSAYTKAETRVGPPLDYVADKLRSSLQSMQRLIREIITHVPDDRPVPEHLEGTEYSIKNDHLLTDSRNAFGYAIIAYLALNNLLGVADNDGLHDRLLAMDREQFRLWLNGIDREGTVTGD